MRNSMADILFTCAVVKIGAVRWTDVNAPKSAGFNRTVQLPNKMPCNAAP
jgi:hypothetical protein